MAEIRRMMLPPTGNAASKKQAQQRKKHWPLTLKVQLPKMDDLINISTNTQIKVKQLRELIREKAPKEAEIGEVPPERLVLQIEGGEVLKKGSAMLDEINIKDN